MHLEQRASLELTSKSLAAAIDRRLCICIHRSVLREPVCTYYRRAVNPQSEASLNFRLIRHRVLNRFEFAHVPGDYFISPCDNLFSFGCSQTSTRNLNLLYRVQTYYSMGKPNPLPKSTSDLGSSRPRGLRSSFSLRRRPQSELSRANGLLMAEADHSSPAVQTHRETHTAQPTSPLSR